MCSADNYSTHGANNVVMALMQLHIMLVYVNDINTLKP